MQPRRVRHGEPFGVAVVLAVAVLALCSCDRDESDTSITAAPAAAAPTTANSRIITVDPAELRPGPVQHESLTPEQLARIARIRQALREVDESPEEQWINDFKRDTHPDEEIAIWEAIAQAYTAYNTGRTLTPAAKREVFSLLLSRSMADGATVLEQTKLTAVTRAEAEQALALYVAPPRPISVTKSPR
jgi:hypothetical protein